MLLLCTFTLTRFNLELFLSPGARPTVLLSLRPNRADNLRIIKFHVLKLQSYIVSDMLSRLHSNFSDSFNAASNTILRLLGETCNAFRDWLIRTHYRFYWREIVITLVFMYASYGHEAAHLN